MKWARSLRLFRPAAQKPVAQTGITRQMYMLLAAVVVPLLAAIGVLIVMLVSINQQYTGALQNAITAAQHGVQGPHGSGDVVSCH